MLNPLLNESHARLATAMVERAAKLPRGHRVALVMVDGAVICFGHERVGKTQNLVLFLQRRLFEKGIEPLALAFTEDGNGWVIVGMMPAPGCKSRAVEAELDELLRHFRTKRQRRRRRHSRAKKASARQRLQEPGREAAA